MKERKTARRPKKLENERTDNLGKDSSLRPAFFTVYPTCHSHQLNQNRADGIGFLPTTYFMQLNSENSQEELRLSSVSKGMLDDP